MKNLQLILYLVVEKARSGGSDSKESACNVGDPSSIPGLGRSPGEGNGYLLMIYKYFHSVCGLFFRPLCCCFQSLSHALLFVTPWTAALQASLSFTISWSLLRLRSIESVMPSNHLILCHLLFLPSIFPNIRVFSNESVLCIRCPGVSASASVLPMNIQD